MRMNEGAFVATVITVFTCVGMIVTALWAYDWLTDRIAEYKLHKLRRRRQKERLKRYQTGDIRPAPIAIAREYAIELEAKEKLTLLPSVRKATGLLSDPAAQALWQK